MVASSPSILRRVVPSFERLLLISTILRIALIVYSEWHDAHSVVKYTDVDYRVFSDAAHFVLHPSPDNRAQGPLGKWLNIGDPYTRATYRYTPLLALLMAPNQWLHASSGKYVFAGADILAGVLMYKMLVGNILAPRAAPGSSALAATAKEDPSTDAEARPGASDTERRGRYATALVAVHLLNPLVFTISTRGSSEAVLSLFSLAMLHCALEDRWDAAAVLLGLATHWKIYPFIYGAACLGALGGARGTGRGWQGYARTLVNGRTARFGLLSAGTFAVLGAAMYAIWGHPFLYESYLYHLHRLDHRHNFSPYFYLMYLSHPSAAGAAALGQLPAWRGWLRSPLVGFVPQMALGLGTGLLFGRRKDDLVFAWFVQTAVFVVFNKVCTSQYFLWYMIFLPLLIPRLRMSAGRAVLCLGIWTGTQALWLSEAYKLEFLGENVFYGLWVRGLIYVVGNCWVLAQIMCSYVR